MTSIHFHNLLNQDINLVVTGNGEASYSLGTIGYNGQLVYNPSNGWSGNFKNGFSGSGVTLFEISVNSYANNDFYDLSVLKGYNVPMKVYAPNGGEYLQCTSPSCPDAYGNGGGTHGCKTGGTFLVIFQN